MKVFVLSEIVILFAIYLQSKNAVYSEESPNLATQNENTEASSTSLHNQDQQIETSSLKPNIAEPSTNETLKTDAVVNNETSNDSIALATTNSTGLNNTDGSITKLDSKEITIMPDEGLNASNQAIARMKNKSHKSVVEIIANHSHNNSFVLTNLLNFSRNKYDVSPIGAPIDLADFIETLAFKNETISFRNKMTYFMNIHASGIPSSDSVHSYYNNFTCTSQHLGKKGHVKFQSSAKEGMKNEPKNPISPAVHFQIGLAVIPENMTFAGDYVVKDGKTNETSNGTFVFYQTKTRLWYKVFDISEIRNNGHNLKSYGDIYFGNGQVNFTQLSDHQSYLMATSSEMLNNVKSHMLENLNVSYISKPIDQLISAFPFLSICSPTTPSTSQLDKTTNYYVIDEIVVLGKNTPAQLQLGPMVIKGLDNFTSGNIVSMKGQLRESPNHFLIFTQASQIQGQCDWRLLNDTPHQPSINSSFTFIIEQVGFTISADFSESWNVNYLDIRFKGISIHRLDKNAPKMLGFIKMILEDFVQDAVKNSLIKLFDKHFPTMVTPTMSTTTHMPTVKPKTSATRQVVYVTPYQPSNETRVTEDDKNHLPFPRRRKVFTPCKDTRKWWQKLFYRNKCKDRVNEED